MIPPELRFLELEALHSELHHILTSSQLLLPTIIDSTKGNN